MHKLILLIITFCIIESTTAAIVDTFPAGFGAQGENNFYFGVYNPRDTTLQFPIASNGFTQFTVNDGTKFHYNPPTERRTSISADLLQSNAGFNPLRIQRDWAAVYYAANPNVDSARLELVVNLKDTGGACTDADGVTIRVWHAGTNQEIFQSSIDAGDFATKTFTITTNYLRSSTPVVILLDPRDKSDTCDDLEIQRFQFLDTAPATPVVVADFQANFCFAPPCAGTTSGTWTYGHYQLPGPHVRQWTKMALNGASTLYSDGDTDASVTQAGHVIPTLESSAANNRRYDHKKTVFRWSSPANGQVQVDYAFNKLATGGTDGVRVQIVHDETVIHTEIIGPNDVTPKAFSSLLNVNIHSFVDFVVDPIVDSTSNYDGVGDTVAITLATFGHQAACTANWAAQLLDFEGLYYGDRWGPGEMYSLTTLTASQQYSFPGATGPRTQMKQQGNTSPPTLFKAPFPAFGTYKFTISTGDADDDYIGFTVGFFGTKSTLNDAFSMEWNCGASCPGGGNSGPPGMRVYRKEGLLNNRGTLVKTLATLTCLSLTQKFTATFPWQKDVEYDVVVQFRKDALRFWIDEKDVLNQNPKMDVLPILVTTGTPITEFKEGHFAFYSNSQGFGTYKSFTKDVSVSTEECVNEPVVFTKSFGMLGCTAVTKVEIDWKDGNTEDLTSAIVYSGSIGTVTASHVYQLVNWYKPEICVTAGATTDCDTLDAIVIKVGDMIWPKLTDTMYMYRVVRFEWTIPLTSTNPLINIILTHAASGNKHYVRQNHPSASASFFWYPHKMLPGSYKVEIIALPGNCALNGAGFTVIKAHEGLHLPGKGIKLPWEN